MTTDYATCTWHPDRRAGVICQRCDRPICPSCMNQASVGFHCPDCAAKGKQRVVAGQAAFSAAFRANLTYALIAVNVGVWLLSMASGERSTLFDFGANGQVIDAGGEWYRIVTSAFLHWGVVHLALNMLALWNIGPAVERALGWQRFGLVYASALLAGSAGALLLDPNAITAGASGAIYGLLGALVILYRRAGINVWRSGLGLTLALNFFITVTIPNVSLGGHLGGLVGGLLSTYLLVELPRRVSSPKLPLALAVAAVPALAGVALLAASTWQNPLFN